MISRLSFFLKAGDIGGVEPSFMEETVLAFCRPLIHEMPWLGKEMSASHVLRSMISLLSGLPPVAEKKGKNSKHQHSVIMAETIEALQHPGEFYFSEIKSFYVPDSFKEELLSGVDSLLKKSKRDIQLMIADTSSCALISILLRVISNPRLFPHRGGVNRAQRLFNLALEVNGEGEPQEGVESSENNGIVSSVYYNMAGDRAGSYFLETLSEVAPLDFLIPLVTANVIESCREYALDQHGNFVVQAIAKRFSTTLQTPSTMESPDKSQRKALVSVSKKLVDAFLVPDNVIGQLLSSGKAGVVNWLLDLANTSGHSSSADSIALSLFGFWQSLAEKKGTTNNNEETNEEEEEEEEFPSSSVSFHAVPVDLIASYLSERFTTMDATPKGNNNSKSKKPEKPAADGETKEDGTELMRGNGLPDSQQLLLARLLGTLLKSANDGKTTVAKVITSLSKEALKVIATSGPMSKAILDTFFVTFANSQELKTIGLCLVTIGVELAYHFVGQHVVRKVYEFSDLRGKEKWVTLVSNEKLLLGKSKEGRNTMQFMNVELFTRDPAEWRSAVKKQMKASSLFADLTNNTASSASSSAAVKNSSDKSEQKSSKAAKKAKVESSNDETKSTSNKQEVKVDDEDDDEDDEEGDGDGGDNAANKKRKRKRKRPQGKAAAVAGSN